MNFGDPAEVSVPLRRVTFEMAKVTQTKAPRSVGPGTSVCRDCPKREPKAGGRRTTQPVRLRLLLRRPVQGYIRVSRSLQCSLASNSVPCFPLHSAPASAPRRGAPKSRPSWPARGFRCAESRRSSAARCAFSSCRRCRQEQMPAQSAGSLAPPLEGAEARSETRVKPARFGRGEGRSRALDAGIGMSRRPGS